jgi:hypothetical protein
MPHDSSPNDDAVAGNVTGATPAMSPSRRSNGVFGFVFLALSIPFFVSWWWIHTETRVSEDKRTKTEITAIGWPTPFVTMTDTTTEFGNEFLGGTKSKSETEYDLLTWSFLSCPFAVLFASLALWSFSGAPWPQP